MVIDMTLPKFSLLARDSTIGFHHPVPAEVKRKKKGEDLLSFDFRTFDQIDLLTNQKDTNKKTNTW